MIVPYEDSILASVAAIREYYGLSSSFAPEHRLQKLLQERKPKQIFLILIDAMGANLIEKKLPPEAFARKNMLYKTMTVFPPTTTAATTAIQNGKAPNENAWLGWCEYFPEVDDTVIPFRGIGYYSDINYGENYVYDLIPVTSTDEELRQQGIPARVLYPAFREDGCASFAEMTERLIGYSHTGEYRYIYAYWDEYDSLMHKVGPSSPEADACLLRINSELQHLADNLAEDTMMIVVADHGQVDIHRDVNLYYTKYRDYFYRAPSIETRAQALFVKEECRERFEKEFKEEFQDDFVLLSKQQVLDTKLFGPHRDHPRFEGLLGDYLAIAKSDVCFSYRKDPAKAFKFAGQHAGMCPDELYIPLIAYQK
ncbi:MAG: alkaline phosphatase family protein [Erysipelotrichaceae bacterium]|nr:alkaline phosphatase family protein [Erysipelotrichaceae bacterium]